MGRAHPRFTLRSLALLTSVDLLLLASCTSAARSHATEVGTAERRIVDSAAPEALDALQADAARPDRSAPDATWLEAFSAAPAPVQIAPLSTATVTSQTPLIRFALPAGAAAAQLELCPDRACAAPSVIENLGAGPATSISTKLTPGVHFWRLRGLDAHGRPGTASSPTWEMFVGWGSPTVAPKVNDSWGTTLDLNGDGLADTAVGTSSAAAFGTCPGSCPPPASPVLIYLGTRSSWGTASPIQINPPPGSTSFGWSVASAGDLNGDGLGDLVVGDPTGNAAYVYLGAAGSSWSPGTPVVLSGPWHFGASVTGAGDVNGDGLADVAIQGSGQVFVYPGVAGSTWIAPTPITLKGGSSLDSFDFVASAGDVNGDGLADLVAPSLSCTTGVPRRVFLFLGAAGTAWTPPAPIVLSVGTDCGASFGPAAANAGDLNNDGLADLVVGAPGATGDSTASQAYVYLGAQGTGWSPSSPVVINNPSSSTFGRSVAGAGDVNGDGMDDLAIGDDGTGTAAVYLGAAGTAWTPGMPILVSGSSSSLFAFLVAGAGDVNGDGLADLLVSAYSANTIYVYAGAPGSSWKPGTPMSVMGMSGFGEAVATILGPLPFRLL